MTLPDLSEVLFQNVTFSNQNLQVRKLTLEDGVLTVLFWDVLEDILWRELDFEYGMSNDEES